MASAWIIHRDPRQRAALARLARVGTDALIGEPGDAGFAHAAAPRVVVLGLAGDFESELEFAHRLAPRLRGVRWILVAPPGDRDEAARLFDCLAIDVLPFPPRADELGARVRAALRSRTADRLSDRRQRDALSERFSRWFADLVLPNLLRALDPRLADVPLLVRGERGTGRALLAQYVHAFGASAGGAFAFVPCSEVGSPQQLLDLLRLGGEGPADRQGLTVCLEDADRLPGTVQQELRRWIEFGPPGSAVRATRVRWMASVADDEAGVLARGLSAELAQAFAGVSVRIPPLRERTEAIERFAQQTAAAWCSHRNEPMPELAVDALEALAQYPWPGNHRELEAVVVRTLATGPRSPWRAEALRFDAVEDGGSEATRADDAAGAPEEPTPPGDSPEPATGVDASPNREGGDRAPRSGPARHPAGPAHHAPGPAPPRPAEPADDAGQTPERPVAEPAPAVRAPAQRAGPPAASGGSPIDDAGPEDLDRLARALGHELRNPLVAIRTFSELLPERFDDPEFRERFRTAVAGDVDRLEQVMERLTRFGSAVVEERGPVDVTALLEEILDARRSEIRSRRLMVLKELEFDHPRVEGRAESLRAIFEAVVDRLLAWVPDGGNLYVASRHHARGPGGSPCLRVLLRLPRPKRSVGSDAAVDDRAASRAPELDASLDLLLAELRLRSEGGSLTTSGLDGDETVLVVDLPSG